MSNTLSIKKGSIFIYSEEVAQLDIRIKLSSQVTPT